MIALIVVEAVLFGVFLAADLLTKHYAMPFLEANGTYVLINKVLALTPSHNDGAGFGILSSKTGLLIGVTVVGLVLMLAVLVYAHLRMDLKRKRNRFLVVTLVMMIAGGLGNLVDRCMFGYVRDFIDYTVVKTLFNINFAICNVADLWLTLGMIFILIYVIFFWRESDKPTAAPEADAFRVSEAERLMAAHEAAQTEMGTEPAVGEDAEDVVGESDLSAVPPCEE